MDGRHKTTSTIVISIQLAGQLRHLDLLVEHVRDPDALPDPAPSPATVFHAAAAAAAAATVQQPHVAVPAPEPGRSRHVALIG